MFPELCTFRYITAKKLSSLMGIPITTIRELMKTGEIPWVPLGKRKLANAEAFIKHLESKETRCKPATHCQEIDLEQEINRRQQAFRTKRHKPLPRTFRL